jgi:hypothetical protein
MQDGAQFLSMSVGCDYEQEKDTKSAS